mgnify:CR=1 FL=1
MICKELESLYTDDKLIKAGYDASKQIAYYLKKEFSSDKDIQVFNNLRFLYNGEYTQIDHLIIHRYGFIIIESKSAKTKISYNEIGEFSRFFNGEWKGEKSFVKQAEEQKNILRKILTDNEEKLFQKNKIRIQRKAKDFQFDTLVAVSSSCPEIVRPQKDQYKNKVIKAEFVVEKVKEIIEAYRKKTALFSLSLEIIMDLADKEKEDIAEFFLSINEPSKEYIPPTPQKKEKIKPLSACPNCGSAVKILWGKLKNYYWHCYRCNYNQAIKHHCPECNQVMKIRKEKENFYIYCDKCNLEGLYYQEKNS